MAKLVNSRIKISHHHHLTHTYAHYYPRSEVLRTRAAKWALFGSIGVYLVFLYFMTVCANYASRWSPSPDTHPVLPDLGLRMIPSSASLWMTDLFVSLAIYSSFANIILFDSQPVKWTMRIGITLCIAHLLRGIAILVTSLPDPRPGCQRILSNPWATFALHRCGDCLFSGHVSIITTFSLYWISSERQVKMMTLNKLIRQYRVSCLLQTLTWTSFFWCPIVILANRAHYTVDLFVGIYTVIGIWWSVAYGWQRYLESRPGWENFTLFHYLPFDNKGSI